MRESPDQAKADDSEEPPDFDALENPGDLLEGERTRDDFLSVAWPWGMRHLTSAPD